MHSVQGRLQLSASDLVNHLACRHLTELNAEVAVGARAAPNNWDPMLELLRERGLAHERAYIEHLEESGHQVTSIGGVGIDAATVAATVEAMRSGREVIFQGALADGRWGGRADILRRVNVPSALGDWSYEVIDTKLARETRGGTVLQLALYSDLVSSVQGALPERMYVVAPWTEFEPQVYRTNDYVAYYRLVKVWLESALASHTCEPTYPDQKEHCDVCRWSRQCDSRRRGDDHPCLVAGIYNRQIDELKDRGVATTLALAALPLPLEWKPERGAAVAYERIREQARVQVESREKGRPVYEVLEPEPEVGLARLPEPSRGDIFFDFEGDPFVGPAGLEYLFGYLTANDAGLQEYTGLWAFSYDEEKRSFEDFVDWVMARWERYPDLHIYHFAPYEPSAMKRLMGRHATREEEVDRMLRAGLFVDLYRVVRGGLRAGVESYSIKELERFFGFQRDVPLSEANSALYGVSRPLELGYPEAIRAEHREAVEGYNRDDCASTYHLRDWLEGIRGDLVEGGAAIERPQPGDGEATEELTERQKMIRALAEHLAGDVPASEADRSPEQHALWLLANILDWHRREEKAAWWEFFRLSDSSVDDLMDERQAVAQLQFEAQVKGPGGLPVHRYSFPVQETGLRGGEDLRMPGGDPIGSLVSIDTGNRTVDIKKRGKTKDVHPEAVFAHDIIWTGVLKDALVGIGEHVADHGISPDGPYRAARDLLLRAPPRLGGEPIRRPGETVLGAALRIANTPGFGVLPIQGPPGAGKTFTAARMICELVQSGARVGITANSHKVIVNLLDAALAAAQERDLDLRAVRKVGGKITEEAEDPRVTLTPDNDRVFGALTGGCQVAAGTAWLWARPEARDSVDVLFVDEAAQMSLANVLAISHAAPGLVLLGDPQQLDQPTQGSHPDGTGVSALAHLLGGRQTIEAHQGLFLGETWRLHPEICAFTSEVFYEGRLTSRPGLEGQRVISQGPVTGTGLRFLPVSHHGNQSFSDEEADRVAALVRGLVDGDSVWVDHSGCEKPIGWDDVLIISPYNAQVFKIQERLPATRVGTVDKFQGQEAPVVVYSMATSTPEEAPHGMEFLYSLNRLNVATSRARCVCVLIGSPDLFAPECRTPRQMQLANAFCRYRELATEIAL
ncbi:MAG: TM0106 family RecB-like putative nuclease [Dehalococcoidia bacterium]|nr:TM0106 family RecB-like putative nuclease [Dehalococcoidia bacterium]